MRRVKQAHRAECRGGAEAVVVRGGVGCTSRLRLGESTFHCVWEGHHDQGIRIAKTHMPVPYSSNGPRLSNGRNTGIRISAVLGILHPCSLHGLSCRTSRSQHIKMRTECSRRGPRPAHDQCQTSCSGIFLANGATTGFKLGDWAGVKAGLRGLGGRAGRGRKPLPSSPPCRRPAAYVTSTVSRRAPRPGGSIAMPDFV